MKIIPKTRDEWGSLVSSATKGAAIVLDNLYTLGIAQYVLGRFYDLRLKKTLKELRDIPSELKMEIQSKVSIEYIKSNDFLIFYSNALEELIKVKNIEKLKYFRSAVISGMTRGDIEEGRKTLFIDCLGDLSVDSLILLSKINEKCDKNRYAFIGFSQIQGWVQYKNEDYLMANLRSLERYHMIEIIAPVVRAALGYSHSIIYDKLGKDFISFIKDY